MTRLVFKKQAEEVIRNGDYLIGVIYYDQDSRAWVFDADSHNGRAFTVDELVEIARRMEEKNGH